jgi:hypothetical protein
MHCRLLIPDLLPPEPEFHAALGQQRFPALELLLARGRRRSRPWHGIEQWLMECFAVARQTDWPSAPFALLGEGTAPGDARWLHAEPVHLRPDGDRVRLADPSLLHLTQEEARALAASVDAHFGDALHIEVIAPTRWYARFAAPPAEETVPLARVAGGVGTASASLRWHALMNEVQMLLHEHPVNEAREARGELPVNGLWFWGAGRLAPAADPGLRAVLASNPLARGLAAASGVRHARLPERIDRWLENADPDGVHLFVLQELSAGALAGNVEQWSSALPELETRLFAPLLHALKSGRIGMITLLASGGEHLLESEAIRADLRRIWRRSRPLAWHATEIQGAN